MTLLLSTALLDIVLLTRFIHTLKLVISYLYHLNFWLFLLFNRYLRKAADRICLCVCIEDVVALGWSNLIEVIEAVRHAFDL